MVHGMIESYMVYGSDTFHCVWYIVYGTVQVLIYMFDVHGWNMVWHHLVEVLLDMVFG